jgi:hypothetical protein
VDVLAALEDAALRDPGGRGVRAFHRPGALAGAAESLLTGGRTLMCTGFPVGGPDGAGAPETDGPGAAVVLGEALARLGHEVSFLADRRTVPLLQALGVTPLDPAPLHVDGAPSEGAAALLVAARPTHVVAVEVPGRAADGQYHRMNGQVNSHVETAVDLVLLAARARGLATVAVGDGGNEAGLGGLRDAVVEAVPHGAAIATVVEADWPVVAGSSTWGALALVAGLSARSGRDLLPSPDRLRDDLEAIVALGAVDGFSGLAEARIDGQPLEATLELLATLRRLVGGSLAA